MLFFWVRLPTCRQESILKWYQGLVAGKAFDDFGPKWPIILGSFLHVFGLMMTSISDKFWQFFLAQSVCSAIGCSFLFYPCTYPSSQIVSVGADSLSNGCREYVVP